MRQVAAVPGFSGCTASYESSASEKDGKEQRKPGLHTRWLNGEILTPRKYKALIGSMAAWLDHDVTTDHAEVTGRT